MSNVKAASSVAASYDKDFYDWTVRQADALRSRSAASLDWENLAEEIESLGRSDQREVTSRLTTLLTHLLKWRYQPEKRTDSWAETIARERIELPLVFEQSPSLARFAESIFVKAYGLARREAARQTRLARRLFPEISPFTLEDALDPDFWPGKRPE
jgi:hypothetical protein